MTIRVSGRHMDVGESFRSRIEDKLMEQIAKYFDGNYSGTVVISKESSRYTADCLLRLDTGVTFQAAGMAHDPELSFQEALEKTEKRLRRYKRRLKDHKGATNGKGTEVAYSVFAPISEAEDDEIPEDYAPAIVAVTSFPVGVFSVAGAVMELDRRDSPVVIFKNAGNGEINIVYRRADGNVGWVDPSTLRDRA